MAAITLKVVANSASNTCRAMSNLGKTYTIFLFHKSGTPLPHHHAQRKQRSASLQRKEIIPPKDSLRSALNICHWLNVKTSAVGVPAAAIRHNQQHFQQIF